MRDVQTSARTYNVSRISGAYKTMSVSGNRSVWAIPPRRSDGCWEVVLWSHKTETVYASQECESEMQVLGSTGIILEVDTAIGKSLEDAYVKANRERVLALLESRKREEGSEDSRWVHSEYRSFDDPVLTDGVVSIHIQSGGAFDQAYMLGESLTLITEGIEVVNTAAQCLNDYATIYQHCKLVRLFTDILCSRWAFATVLRRKVAKIASRISDGDVRISEVASALYETRDLRNQISTLELVLQGVSVGATEAGYVEELIANVMIQQVQLRSVYTVMLRAISSGQYQPDELPPSVTAISLGESSSLESVCGELENFVNDPANWDAESVVGALYRSSSTQLADPDDLRRRFSRATGIPF